MTRTASVMRWRALLEDLTDALASAEHDDDVIVDAAGQVAWVDSTLDDVDHRERRAREPRASGATAALIVLRPDGLWEWAVRRDFVRGLTRGTTAKRRLAATLAGPKTRRRFEVALSTEPTIERAFELYRRRRVRAWAARIVRVHAAPIAIRAELWTLVATARSASMKTAASRPEPTPRQRARQRKRRARVLRRNRAR